MRPKRTNDRNGNAPDLITMASTSWGALEPWGPPVVQLHGLRPDPANPRRISDEELDALERRVITKATTGWTKPELAEPRVSGTVVVCPEW